MNINSNQVFKKKRQEWILFRIIILFFIPIIIPCLYYDSILKTSYFSIDIPGLMENKDYFKDTGKSYEFEEILNKLRDSEKRFNTLIKPGVINFIKYGFFIKNNFSAVTKEGELIETKLRIDINKNYKEIKFGEEEKIFDFSNIDEYNFGEMTYSFVYYYQNGEEMPEGILIRSIENKDNLNFHSKPSYLSLMIIYVSSVIFLYGIILLINAFREFIILGKPFNKI